MPDALYQQVEGLAGQLHMTVPELLRKAAEQILTAQPKPQQKPLRIWRFPEGQRLGAFQAPVEDWRLLANEATA